jgi:predicted dehydrogenase
MKTQTNSSSTGSPVTRRSFLKSGAVVTAGVASLSWPARAQVNLNSKLRIFQIGVGGIGGLQRSGLKGHPQVEWAGFCDVDQRELDGIKKQNPNAWLTKDYREAFASRAGDFDAVLVDVPDFHHAPMILTALKHNKHVYAQKPLVHQLAELRMIRDGLQARPNLVTQMGNQRACNKGRMQSVELLRRGQLGRPVEAWVWTGGVARGHYFVDAWSGYGEPKPVPEYLDWNLWRGPLTADLPYTEDLAPRRWRAYWETGGGQLADWGCHLLDLLYFAYDLSSPEAVITHTPRPSNTGHTSHNQSTLTFAGGKPFAREKFVVHYNDDALLPSFAALGLPPTKVGANHTMVVCEEGTAQSLEGLGGQLPGRKEAAVDAANHRLAHHRTGFAGREGDAFPGPGIAVGRGQFPFYQPRESQPGNLVSQLPRRLRSTTGELKFVEFGRAPTVRRQTSPGRAYAALRLRRPSLRWASATQGKPGSGRCPGVWSE